MSEQASGMIRHLLTYASACLIGNILLLSIYAIYLLVGLSMNIGNDEAQWGMLTLNWTVLLTVSVMNCFALYYLFTYNDMTRKRLQFILLFFAVLVGGYSLLAVMTSVSGLAWTFGVLAALLLPVPVILSRPTSLAVIQALPVEPKDIDYFA